MREQNYPPKRPNMAHFGTPQKRQARDEAKTKLEAPDDRGTQNEPRHRPGEKPAP